MRVTLRPCTPEDFYELIGERPAHRVRGFASVIGDRLLGVGGLVRFPGGDVWASCLISEDGRRYPVAVHRAGKALMQLARECGFSPVYANAEHGRDGAERWLEALGFRRLSGNTFIWSSEI